MGSLMRKKDAVEISILKRYGLRYSILAAWESDLRSRKTAIPSSIAAPLARARVKISSGCFTVCDVACDLDHIEALLISAASTAGEESTDSWMEMLGQCMSDAVNLEDFESRIAFPAVKMYFNRLNFDGACTCGVGDRQEA